MQIVQHPKQMQQLALEWRAQGRKIALVPTMGYLHAGHESLIRAARQFCQPEDRVVLSLFVNPTQFAPGEDLDKYPHDFERDRALAHRLGVDVLFAPQASEIYHPAHSTWVEVPSLSTGLCGKSRPTHFRGVATVVNKLFMLTQATDAFFGEKDWQQLAIIRCLARDLDIPVQVRACPIVREADGLAMSSRNVYLNEVERAQAPNLYKGLLCAAELFRAGQKNSSLLARATREYWAEHLSLGREDYLAFVEPDTLVPLDTLNNRALVLTAMHLGKARLIDNLLLAESASLS